MNTYENSILLTIQIDNSYHNWRLDKLIAEQTALSRTQAALLVQKGHVSVNNSLVKASLRVTCGDTVAINYQVDLPRLVPTPMPLNILFEDESIIVIDKPSGIVTHPGAGDTGPTLIAGILYHCGHKYEWDDKDLRPGVVHRLDKDTTGVMVFAKTSAAKKHLQLQFANKTTNRRYLALLDGIMDNHQQIVTSYLSRDPKNRTRFCSIELEKRNSLPNENSARWAQSVFTRLSVYAHQLTLAEVKLMTGRTHQVRLHSKHLCRGIIGDKTYCQQRQYSKTIAPIIRSALTQCPRQMLHAKLLEFEHPKGGHKIKLHSPLPDDFQQLLSLLKTCELKALS